MKHTQGERGILKSAYEKGVPVFVPAFTDSEMGLDTALNNRLRESTGRHKIRYDPFEDLGMGTRVQQPAIFLVCACAWDAHDSDQENDGTGTPVAAAGHSLGLALPRQRSFAMPKSPVDRARPNPHSGRSVRTLVARGCGLCRLDRKESLWNLWSPDLTQVRIPSACSRIKGRMSLHAVFLDFRYRRIKLVVELSCWSFGSC